MKHLKGEFVEVKLVGLAKIDEACDTEYFLFFADGKRGGGWKDHDLVGSTTEKKFWAEWHTHKRCA